jgi:hypothetical protein
MGDDFGEWSMRDYISDNPADNFVVVIDERTAVNTVFHGEAYGVLSFVIDNFLSGGISLLQAANYTAQLVALGAKPINLAEGADFLSFASGVLTNGGESLFISKDGSIEFTLSYDLATQRLTVISDSGQEVTIGPNDRFRVTDSGEIIVNPPTIAEEYGKPLCFPSGTGIITDSGHTSIEAIRLGDLVLAFDPTADFGRGALVPKRVVRLFHNETKEWLRLSWHEGGEDRELTVTPGHRFLDVAGRFRRIDEITTDIAPTVVLADGSLAQVRAERIVWSAATRHLFEEVEALRAMG